MATILSSRRQYAWEGNDAATFEAVVLFSMLGLWLFLGMAFASDPEVLRNGLLYAG
jgi:hypothetical protein